MTRKDATPKPGRPAPPRARPGTAVQTKGQHRAGEILIAARAVLVEEGYPAFTARKVAQRLQIRQSNVQYYFPTKADLVRALFERAMQESSKAFALQTAGRKLSPSRRILWSVDQFLQSHHSLEEQVFLRELWALSAHDPDVAEAMNGFYARLIDLVTRSLLALNPKLGRRKAQRRALIVVSLIDGLSIFHGAVGLEHPAVDGIEKEVRDVVLELAR